MLSFLCECLHSNLHNNLWEITLLNWSLFCLYESLFFFTFIAVLTCLMFLYLLHSVLPLLAFLFTLRSALLLLFVIYLTYVSRFTSILSLVTCVHFWTFAAFVTLYTCYFLALLLLRFLFITLHTCFRGCSHRTHFSAALLSHCFSM